MLERETQTEKKINLEDYFHIDRTCNICKGPLELKRDKSCSKCKLKSRIHTLHDMATDAIADARRAITQYL